MLTNRRAFLLSLLLSLTALGGCTTTNVTRFEAIPARIQKGGSTQSNVEALLGAPVRRELTPAGEIWHYGGKPDSGAAEEVVAAGVGMAPYGGYAVRAARALGKANQKGKPTARFTFDRSGVVRDYSVVIP